MKFLLAAIHAKYIHTGLALYSLRGYAGRELREYIEVAEYTINQQMEEVLADLYDRKPDAIGFSCYIWNFSVVKRLVREFSKLRPDVPVWLGGPEVSYEYKKIFEELPEVTGIMSGEKRLFGNCWNCMWERRAVEGTFGSCRSELPAR